MTTPARCIEVGRGGGAEGEGVCGVITGAQMREVLRLFGWRPSDVARRSKLSVGVIQRASRACGEAPITIAQEEALRRALEIAGVEFVADDGEGPGVRLRTGP